MVLPSEYAAFGVVVIEAILCGCPVIASNKVGAGRELIYPIDSSFIYPCRDLGTLSTLLPRVLSDHFHLVKFRIAAAERIKTWSPRKYIAATVDAVERAVSHVRPTS
jgi:glycosyltransferase involved in cell wall biosynthesis